MNPRAVACLKKKSKLNVIQMKQILILCIGNICRSPIAEYFLASRLSATYPDVSVRSAGLGALVGYSADPTSCELMLARGIDLSQHRARQVTAERVFTSDLILTMTTEQQEQVEATFSGTRGRVHRLGKWSGFDVSDPYKRPKAIFEQATILIEQGLDEWCKKIWN